MTHAAAMQPLLVTRCSRARITSPVLTLAEAATAGPADLALPKRLRGTAGAHASRLRRHLDVRALERIGTRRPSPS